MRKYIIDEINAFIKDLKEAVCAFEESGELYTDEIIVEIIQSFDQLYAYLKKNIDLKELSAFSRFLEEMDMLLEKVCSGQITADIFYTTMQKQLRWISEELKKADVNYEIVFLPYKASMWDSFDSVWREAFQDEKCNCTVAALPYYTKQQDGSLSERISEKDQFPDYVPVIDAEDYDFAEKQPEIIFIHNPYDEYNKITTVEPKFYSKVLKQYTKKLVYIPYFVADEALEDNFTILPALRFADVVVVESEKIAEQYKKNYMWENKEKFVAWGSPKYDMVFADRDNQKIPDEWKERIENRKVILYNTHLNNLLNHPKETIEKIRYVIELFADRKDVVLLWRPHPLSMSALVNTGEAVSEYRTLVKEFIQSKKGIYDDTANLSRAIAIADAYLGDHSSLVHLFRKAGKPVFFQKGGKIFQITDEEKRSVMFADAYFMENGFWFSASTYNGLYYYDFTEQELYFKGAFPDEGSFVWHLYSKIFFYKGRLFFIPFNAKKLVEYNIEEKTFYSKEIPLRECQHTAKGRGRLFHQAVMAEKKIYLLPWTYDEILCYDMEERTLQPMKKWNKLLHKYTSETAFKFWEVKLINGKIVAPYYEGNLLFFFDLEEKRNEVITIGKNTSEGFSSIEIHENAYYLSSVKRKCICKYFPSTKQCEYYSYASDVISDSSRIRSMKIDNTIYFGDAISGCFFTMSLDDASIQFLSIKPMPFVSMKIYKENKLVLFPSPQDSSLKMQILSNGQVEEIVPVRFSNMKKREEIFRELSLRKQGDAVETFHITIEDYVQLIAEMENVGEKTNYIPCGKVIYEKLL